MIQISDLRELVEREINNIPLKEQPRLLYEPVSYMLQLPAKRMRPVLVLCGCDLFNGDINKALMPALGIEVFHNFTLLHDDIMDNAPLRRAKQTVHEKWNSNIAILSGDTMFVKACQLVMMCDDNVVREVMELFHKTAIEVCEGQQLDMDFESADDVTIVDYIHMITNKTAVLLGASLKTGAIIANAPSDQAEKIYEFGVNIGIAFQLKDDILDVFGDDAKFGKVVGGDIIADKKTFLWIKAHELAQGEQAKQLSAWVGKTDYNSEEKVKAIKGVYEYLNIRELAENEMEKYFNRAIENLNAIDVSTENKDVLRGFAEKLMVREI